MTDCSKYIMSVGLRALTQRNRNFIASGNPLIAKVTSVVINQETGTLKESAGGGDRTHTPLRAPDFESGASASSATPAKESGESRKRSVGLQARWASENFAQNYRCAKVRCAFQ